jgi:hypothetical protein
MTSRSAMSRRPARTPELVWRANSASRASASAPAGPVRAGRSSSAAHLGEELAAGQGFFGLDFVSEAGVAGAGVALEHLDALVEVLLGSGDGAAGTAGDEPGQGPPELSGRQVR